ncbi:MAG: hypothetical protein WC455_18020 [Dehalococcoidia bacterium]|jgi:hypothetical protein
MGYLSFVWYGWKGLRSSWKQIKALDKRGVERFSPKWWRELRKWIEIKIALLCKYEDTRVAKTFGTYRVFLHGMLILLKSDQLGRIEAAAGDNAKLDALVLELESKQTDYTGVVYPAH